ncbi:MAG TPA: DUF2336 domain-containing protein [Xanthobacteraceae bacterium]|nr:DUF2336 domain-containing protein [Xanthobacteraceae bacterium]
MIVREFLSWLQSAPPSERAEGASALARAYLFSPLSIDDRAAAEGAMLLLLDDPSPLVRRALAQAFASSQTAPPAVVHALAADQADVAAVVLEHSPLFVDADLVDFVAAGASAVQTAIARRPLLQRSVAAAIAEVGSAAACLELIENADADIAPFSIDRIVARHGHLAAVRESLLARNDLPVPTRQALVAKLSQTLADFVTARAWLARERAARIVSEACEKATVVLAAESGHGEMRPLVRHLRETGQLTAGLVLRALLSGNSLLFEESLAELSGMPVERVTGLVHGKGNAGFRALYEKAGLPAATFPAFREAIAAMHEDGFLGDCGDASRLKRRMIERVLTRCEEAALDHVDSLMTLLRRFATEAARDEARMFCEQLARAPADDFVAERLIAAPVYDFAPERLAAA